MIHLVVEHLRSLFQFHPGKLYVGLMSRMCVVAFFLEVLGNLQLCYSPLVLVKKIEVEIWANKYILTIKFLSLRLVGKLDE